MLSTPQSDAAFEKLIGRITSAPFHVRGGGHDAWKGVAGRPHEKGPAEAGPVLWWGSRATKSIASTTQRGRRRLVPGGGAKVRLCAKFVAGRPKKKPRQALRGVREPGDKTPAPLRPVHDTTVLKHKCPIGNTSA